MGALASAWDNLNQLRSKSRSPSTATANQAALTQALERVQRAFRSNKSDWDIDDEVAAEDIERNGGIELV